MESRALGSMESICFAIIRNTGVGKRNKCGMTHAGTGEGGLGDIPSARITLRASVMMPANFLR